MAALLGAAAIVMTIPAAVDATPGRPTGHVHGKFEIKTWVETPRLEVPGGGRVIELSATDEFTGGITGHASAAEEHYIRPDGTRDFAGMIVVTGRLGGRSGSFVIRTVGTFDGNTARSRWTVVPGSATGELRGLRGTGTDMTTVADAPFVTYTLDYYLDK